jgi:hypothetical protein
LEDAMTSWETVKPSMFDDIYRELLQLLDPERPREAWRLIFEYDWNRAEDYVGYVAIDDGELVGFMGLIFSEMVIQGRTERFCNVSSLITKPSHRGAAALFVLGLRSLRDHTVTNLSSNDLAYRLFSRMPFDVLETHTRVILPSIAWPSHGANPFVTVDPDTIGSRLDERHQRIFADHQSFAEHLFVQDAEGGCYVLYTLGRRHRNRSVRIHYLSDGNVFAHNIRPIQRTLFQRHHSLIIDCPERMVEHLDIPFSFRKRLRIPRLFMSNRLRRDQISNLYSEAILLNLP